MLKIKLFSLIILFFIKIGFLYAVEKKEINALLIIDSGHETISKDIESYIQSKDGKIINSFPPNIYMGYLPEILDKEIESKFAVKIYREIVDVSLVEKYGETARYAISSWNRKYAKSTLSAPNVITPARTVLRSGTSTASSIHQENKITFNWEDIPGATDYRVQISSFLSFSNICIETIVEEPVFDSYHGAFLERGLYYWRVCALNIDDDQIREGNYSSPASFEITSNNNGVMEIPNNITLLTKFTKGKGMIKWDKVKTAKYYWIQISSNELFESILIDTVVEKPMFHKLNSLIKFNNSYYCRVKVSDGVNISKWINLGVLKIDYPEPMTGDAIYPPKSE